MSNNPNILETGIYRHDIDALRAISILAVLLFHVKSSLFPSGFLGVDVFFVISGFVITNSLLRRPELTIAEVFWYFWKRRINRLLPTAAVVSATTVGVGYFIFFPNDYSALAWSALYNAFFYSNEWFSKTSGYFDKPSEIKPLLHTWSLSVEWQFYFYFLIFIIFCRYFKSVNVFTMVVTAWIFVFLIPPIFF